MTAGGTGKIPAQTIKNGPASYTLRGHGQRGTSSMSDSTIQPGYCQCGCGTHIGFYPVTNRRKGMVKGAPKKFARGHYHPPVEARFWAKVEKLGPDDCWIWNGATSAGYGHFHFGDTHVLAHRWSYEQAIGTIPNGLQLDHLCRTPACVNPDHLEPVTLAENVLRGISLSAKNARKTHCKHGHELTPENTYVRPSGFRNCRACRTLYPPKGLAA
jgi:hypothetical protein